ncbi:MAG: M23 family metallopeptidase [Sinobacterium sp.]|nr:M23 family metallopeptidase [Sinobacterium sp.]
MKLIVLDKSFSGSKEFNINNVLIPYVGAGVLFFILVLLVFIGLTVKKQNEIERYREQLVNIEQQLLFDQHQVSSLKSYSEAVFLEQSRQVGLLQARIIRLEALGGQIADMAGMEKEFNFYQEPAIGGANPAVESLIEHDLLANMAELQARLDVREVELQAIDGIVQNKNINKERYLSGIPVKKGWLSSDFGQRTDPFTGGLAWHKGVDFAGKEGTDVVAVASGIIIWSGKRFGYGNLVEIDHGNGFSTRYGHNKENLVTMGEVVEKGQAIARMGSTGRSTGPHVHYEVLKQGKQVDPHRYIYRQSL